MNVEMKKIEEWMVGIWKSKLEFDGMTYWLTIKNEKGQDQLVLGKGNGKRELDVKGDLEFVRNEDAIWDLVFRNAVGDSPSTYEKLKLWGKDPKKERLIIENRNERFEMIKAS